MTNDDIIILLKQALSMQSTKTVKLRELEKLVDGSMEYDSFFNAVRHLEQEGFLQPVKSQGFNNFGLAYAYRIKKLSLSKQLHEQIRSKQLSLHSLIDLSCYFAQAEENWKQDQEYINKLHIYLTEKGVPNKEAFSPERSYELVGDEKWIDEGGGRVFLNRIGVYSFLRIVPAVEPLMFAVNPNEMNSRENLHLIVENKSVYAALSTCLAESPYTTLIFGSGKGFLSSIMNLEHQLNLPDHVHRLYYFGDLDREGIMIWDTLHQRRAAPPALAFYRALLMKDFTYGKQYQKQNKCAEDRFVSNFHLNEQDKIRQMLAEGGYYPQEALKTDELCDIWRRSWKD
ncbi:Wadjet anti-phage system protein JetD domain-containing protein [Paenibacillus sp. OAS669]|uniref:Wadjet anti-phage system protein JetD domain-containing protein n=1 Tax=Paenibacillus sp. OAS669 TaxID=2663821 RepID=UPI00178A7918|nr:Wadjet anti-phage system protein JetD domain-containing protein [Paenibacillus sp. OAS669]MBE1441275.1 hypothetical protein [Paenibacillus sp. OAS669]